MCINCNVTLILPLYNNNNNILLYRFLFCHSVVDNLYSNNNNKQMSNYKHDVCGSAGHSDHSNNNTINIKRATASAYGVWDGHKDEFEIPFD